jgi:hypothetical protein
MVDVQERSLQRSSLTQFCLENGKTNQVRHRTVLYMERWHEYLLVVLTNKFALIAVSVQLV